MRLSFSPRLSPLLALLLLALAFRPVALAMVAAFDARTEREGRVPFVHRRANP